VSEHPHIVFFGTAEFGIPAITTLLRNEYPIVTIVTALDKPAGRGRQLASSPVKQFALEHQLRLLQPEKLRDKEFIEQISALKPDLFVVVAFRILPPEVFTIPRLGSFNLHASLLPRYRGAAPINWAIIRGERETGVTTFFLRENVDTGNVILQARTPIGPEETAGELHDRLAEIGGEIVLHTVRLIESGKAGSRPQDESTVSNAPKISREDCRIDWTKSTSEIHNNIRGLSPRPCAFTYHEKTLLKIYRATIRSTGTKGSPGEITGTGKNLLVSAKDGTIEVLEIQQEGKKHHTAEEFLRGSRLKPGDRFV